MRCSLENRNAVSLDAHAKKENNEIFAHRIMDLLSLAPKSRVLEVGCGGAELSKTLSDRYGLDCVGLEPFPLYAACIDQSRIHSGFAENIPFRDCSFDLVVAKDVLEHVDDVEQSISELIRVSRKYVYIMSPNYLYPYEAHFKVPFPPKLPKPIAKWYLRLCGFTAAQADFIAHINYVTKLGCRRAIAHSRFQPEIIGVIDIQMAKKYAATYSTSWLTDLFRNSKFELLVVKKTTHGRIDP